MLRKLSICSALVLAIAMDAQADFKDSCRDGCPRPPKRSRSVSSTAVGVAPALGNILTATLARGSRGKILHAEGLLTDAPYAPFCSSIACLPPISRHYVLKVSVNGVPMNPASSSPISVGEDCGTITSPTVVGDATCTVTGHWWLDLDDPANAGLLGVPLEVTLLGGDFSENAVGGLVDLSLQVRLEPK